MARDGLHEPYALVFLEAMLPEIIVFPERRIVLTESKPTLDIGRSSARPALNLQSQATNGWFDSPVMSRKHARLTVDLGQQKVLITDLNSMHGTSLNGEKIGSLEPRPLTQGDKLVFGISVYRNQQTFQPTEVKVGIEFHKAPRATTSPSRIFTVPDDCSTDENEAVDEDAAMLTTTVVVENAASTLGLVDAQQDSLAGLSEMPQLDGHVDADSTFGGAPYLPSPDYETAGDDDESIRLTESSCSPSECSDQPSPGPQSPKNNVEAALETYDEEDEGTDLSWEPNSVNEADQDMRSEDDSVCLEGVFIYDSEDSDESDEPMGPGPVGDRLLETEELLEAEATIYATDLRLCPLPPLSEVVPYGPSAMRRRTPSPSDAALPYAHLRAAGREFEPPLCAALANIDGVAPTIAPAMTKRDTERREVTVQSLGELSGKPEFFQAREHNRRALAEGQKAAAAPMCDLDLTNWFPASAFELQQFIEQQQQQQQQQESQSTPCTGNPEPSAPQKAQPSAGPADIVDEVEPHAMEATARHEMTNLPALQVSGNKGKRKADEISSLTEAEMDQYSRTEVSSRADRLDTRLRQLLITGGPAETAQPSLASPITTLDEQARPYLRPNKRIKRLAERVGFAALGGATVGALVFSSLIYTAPNFV